MHIEITSLIANQPSVEIVKISSGSYNLSIIAKAINFNTARIRSCKVTELAYNNTIQIDQNSIVINVMTLNASHSQTECAANIYWNPFLTGIIIQADFNYSLGADPTVWITKSPISSIDNFLPAAGNRIISLS